MTQTIISNEDIRGIVRERIGNILEDYSDVFRDAHIVGLAIDAVLEIPNLAVVDRDAELPQVTEEAREDRKWAAAFVCGEMEVLKEGWVKEIK